MGTRSYGDIDVVTEYIRFTLHTESAFWVLTCMVETRVGYYARSMCGLKVDQRVLDDVVAFAGEKKKTYCVLLCAPQYHFNTSKNDGFFFFFLHC